MKILLDECIDVRFQNHITGHQVFSVAYMSWKGISNGQLLSLAADNGFDVMVTVDKGTLHQLPSPLAIALVVLRAKRSSQRALAPLVPKLLVALKNSQPRSVSYVD